MGRLMRLGVLHHLRVEKKFVLHPSYVYTIKWKITYLFISNDIFVFYFCVFSDFISE